MRITKKFINSESASNNQVLTADGSGNVNWNTFTGGGGTTVNSVSIPIDFGTESDTLTVTVSASWVTTSTMIFLTVIPNSSDHDPEDVVLEEISVTYGNIINATSFDIFVHAPCGTWGRYVVKAIGV